jgi:hypothetical protein
MTRGMENEDPLLQVTYLSSRLRRDEEEASNKLVKGVPLGKSQFKTEIEENLKFRPARWEMNGEAAVSNEWRVRTP